ncbi:hypothetical protein N7495_006677 [Penicillium taxi]|uniref:uncharacterized protein n=1 Tax=Penicillium taxi TaxID=168475 RepID=UPI0025450CCB|nr:uncharacterized protein N7495_006677 [Penicillium taxi]KAJ5894986.1 hypothetical protein N7495_006677 [Penicillium taxi]
MKLLSKLRKIVPKVLRIFPSQQKDRQLLQNDPDETEDHQQGKYILPAEGEHHLATMMGFPSRCSLPPSQYDAVCNELVELASAISDFEPVRMYVRPEDKDLAESLIMMAAKDVSKVMLIPCPINHCWVRDTGPIYVHEATESWFNKRFALNGRFKEWRGENADDDGTYIGQQWSVMDKRAIQENSDFARWVIDHDIDPTPVTRIDSPICMEGGDLITDGEGTLLITECSVICDKRNPMMTKFSIERELKRLLGIEKVIWLPSRRSDVTDENLHVEARFVRPGVIVCSKPHGTALDLWKDMLDEIEETLDTETDAKGRHLEIHTIEEPDPQILDKTPFDELAASYVNFYFVNGGLVLPKFGDEERDQNALEIMQALLPERVIRQVYINAIQLTGGALHCVTQQVPSV